MGELSSDRSEIGRPEIVQLPPFIKGLAESFVFVHLPKMHDAEVFVRVVPRFGVLSSWSVFCNLINCFGLLGSTYWPQGLNELSSIADSTFLDPGITWRRLGKQT